MLNVAVLGGGIVGICAALRILEYYEHVERAAVAVTVTVTVIAEEYTPQTTGDGSAGLWGPYLLGATASSAVHKWSKATHDFLAELWLSADAGNAGVCLLNVVRLSTAPDGNVESFLWQDIVHGCAPLTQRQLDDYNNAGSSSSSSGSGGNTAKFTGGIAYQTYTAEPRKLLPFLMARYSAKGGKYIQRKLNAFDDFVSSCHYDVVVNCTGLGARALLADDASFAVRGQVTRVRANWQHNVVMVESSDDDDGNYIIPNTESVVLGGTHQEHDYNREVCAQDKEFIVSGCQRLVPGLAHAPHLCDWVGLRPGRTAVRLEAQQSGAKLIIHNYGHGGSGVTLAWGCAGDVVELLVRALAAQHRRHKAKL